MKPIWNDENFINGTDLAERLSELESKTRDEAEGEEYEALWDLASQLDMRHVAGNNSTIVRESYFEEYIREEMYDIGAVERDGLIDGHVDWKGLADACRIDYAEVDFGGVAYLCR